MLNYGKKLLLRAAVLVAFLAILVTPAPKSGALSAEAATVTGYTLSGTTLTVNPDISTGLSGAINQAMGYVRSNYDGSTVYTVKVPAGSYDLTSAIVICANTKLDLTGVTLSLTSSTGNMLRLTTLEENGGYGDEGSILVTGGTFIGNDDNSSSLIRMAHGQNITIENCILTGGGCAHQMEVAAIDNFVVKGCTFRDMKGNGTSEKQEALQLDIPCSTYMFKEVELDGTPMVNVTLTKNTFINVPRGLGTHSMLVGVYHENIDITDNTFENVDGECIVALNYKNCKITGNVIKNSGAGILFENFKANVKAVYTTIYDGQEDGQGTVDNDADSVISNNTITVVTGKHPDESVGIKVYGFNLTKDTQATGKGPTAADIVPSGNYAVENVTVSNNKIKTCGHGIHLMDVKNSTVSGNTIENTKAKSEKDGIFVEFASKNLVIKKNTIKKASRYGIFLQHSSTAKSITDNKILTSCGKYGIGLYDKSSVSGSISGNTIENTKSHGINLYMGCYAKKISKNTIKNSATYPIVINTDSKKKIVVSGNKITAKKGKKNVLVVNGNVKVS